MGRLHSHNYGKSHSTRPLDPKPPSWIKQDAKEIEELIVKYAKDDLPEDLNNIVKKAIGLQKHLKTNKSDNRNVRSLELIEAKVHRLSVYYKKIGRIPRDWKYKSLVAQLE